MMHPTIRARIIEARHKRSQLAELVSEGVTIKDAASHVGLGERAAQRAWKRIKEELGWQAC